MRGHRAAPGGQVRQLPEGGERAYGGEGTWWCRNAAVQASGQPCRGWHVGAKVEAIS